MRLHLFTLDEREAMLFRQAGWKFKRMEGSEWELTWNTGKQGWPAEDPRQGLEENLAEYVYKAPAKPIGDDYDPR